MDRLQATGGRPGVGRDRGAWPVLHPARGDRARRLRHPPADRAHHHRGAGWRAGLSRRPPPVAARWRGGPGPARSVRRHLRVERHGEALPRHRRPGVDGRADPGCSRPSRELDPAGGDGEAGEAGDAHRGRARGVLRAPGGGDVHHDVPVRDPSRPQDQVLGPAGAAGPRPRRRRRPVGDRHPQRLPRGHGRGERPAGCHRRRTGQDGRTRGGRPLRVPARRLPHDRHRGRDHYDIVVLGHVCRTEGVEGARVISSTGPSGH